MNDSMSRIEILVAGELIDFIQAVHSLSVSSDQEQSMSNQDHIDRIQLGQQPIHHNRFKTSESDRKPLLLADFDSQLFTPLVEAAMKMIGFIEVDSIESKLTRNRFPSNTDSKPTNAIELVADEN